MNTLDNDPELIREFLAEAAEQLAELDTHFLLLEQEGDSEAVQAIFRPIHSIKGNASFFGFLTLKGLAHSMETVLDALRTGALAASGSLISLLLEGLDELKAMIERLRQGATEVADSAVLDSLIARCEEAVRQEVDPGQLLRQVHEQLQLLDDCLDPGPSRTAFTALRTLLIQLHGEAPAASIRLTRSSLDAAEPPIDELRQLLDTWDHHAPEDAELRRLPPLLATCQERASAAHGPFFAEMLDLYHSLVPTLGFDPILLQGIREQLDQLPQITETEAYQPSEQSASTSIGLTESNDQTTESRLRTARQERTDRQTRSDAFQADHSMRVPTAHIDTFFDYVGELLVVGDLFDHLQDELAVLADGQRLLPLFRRCNATFAALSEKLRSSIMALRQVPGRQLLKKAPRLVRDIATRSDKSIQIVLEGEDLPLDKSHLEALDAPLVHMVRNAADHGIETSATRLAAGKAPNGRIVISLSATDNDIILTIADDGRGLDLEALRRKAITLELIADTDPLDEDSLIELLFRPGVSTAAAVSDISGRGVGMDVVRRSIENEAGGHISVSSQPGAGTTFRITLPRSINTQIIDGCLVSIRGHSFVLPVQQVRETLWLGPDDLHRSPGGQTFLRRHGRTIPLLDLAALFALSGSPANDGDHQACVILERRHDHIAIAIDALLGVRQVVLRPIEGFPSQHVVSGAALRGDGSVALVLDPERLPLD